WVDRVWVAGGSDRPGSKCSDPPVQSPQLLDSLSLSFDLGRCQLIGETCQVMFMARFGIVAVLRAKGTPAHRADSVGRFQLRFGRFDDVDLSSDTRGAL